MSTYRTFSAGAGTAQGTPCGCVLPDGKTFCALPCTHLLTTLSQLMSAPAFYPLCEDCAYRLRRAELDAYLAGLEAKGEARVIRVNDLGAALEAEAAGRQAVRWALKVERLDLPSPAPLAYRHALRAAHLARKALGLC